MDPFSRRKIGKSQVEVTILGLGGAPLGDHFERIPDAQAIQTVQDAADAGVAFFDTAPWYGCGRSEHRMGHVLRDLPRSSYSISTKVGRVMKRSKDINHRHEFWAGGLPFEVQFDYTYDGVMRSWEDSLQRLGIAKVDVLLIHDLEPNYFADPADMKKYLDQLDQGGGVKALQELKAAGEIGAFGAGVNCDGTITRYLDRGFPLECFLVAMPYTLLDQKVLEKEFPRCQEQGIGVIIGAVFASGILATGPVPGALWAYAPAPDEVMAKARKIQAVCDRHQVSLRAAAIQFPLMHPVVAAVIPGATRPGIVEDNIALLKTAIPPAFWAELKAQGLLHKDAPTGG